MSETESQKLTEAWGRATDGELAAALKNPGEYSRPALDAARAEALRRGIAVAGHDASLHPNSEETRSQESLTAGRGKNRAPLPKLKPDSTGESRHVLLYSLKDSQAWLDCVVLLAVFMALLHLQKPQWLLSTLVPWGNWMDRWILVRLVDFLAVVAVAAALLRWRGLPLSSLGLAARGWRTQLGWGALGGVVAWGLAVMGVQTFEALRVSLSGQPAEPLPKPGESVYDLMYAEGVGRCALLFAVTAAHEELFMRGLLYPRVRRIMGSWTLANGLCAVVFAYGHLSGGPLYAVAYLIHSLVIGALFARSRSLPAAILAHFVTNVLQVSAWLVGTRVSGSGG